MWNFQKLLTFEKGIAYKLQAFASYPLNTGNFYAHSAEQGGVPLLSVNSVARGYSHSSMN